MKTITSLLAVAVLLALTACKQQDEGVHLEPMPESSPDAAAEAPPASAASPVEAAPELAYADSLSRNLATDKYNTQGGKWVDGKLVNDSSRNGYVLFGPYVGLKAGTYTVSLQGNVDAVAAGQFRLDAASGKGTVAHGGVNVTQVGPFPTFDIVLASDVSDLEIRALVPKDARVSITSYQVARKR
ncbi:hypothetical protein MUU77_15385 [Pseudoxanthomonas sp. F37]|uniref:hypothetical protein n=1 Tax=Pseudoxanthomonas TaxID=83618 RepID=UPI001FD53C61|nr:MULTISPECIES: hypothetical protein [Pseudoxanthomonas]UOV06580.1 hypothetical protein MUU75_08155 [Pseudoxanthomonas mexicana]UOV08188.1 hypothetical protein MUU77_15385 [Pseudoxanthomonas sp. F37]